MMYTYGAGVLTSCTSTFIVMIKMPVKSPLT